MKEEEKKATIIRAEGDAQAATMVSEAISKHGPGLVAIRKIEAAQYMVERMNGNSNISFIQGGNTMNMLNLNPGGR